MRALNYLSKPIDIRGIGDPYVLKCKEGRYAGNYFLYATSAENGFKVWSSGDLATWADHGLCFEREIDSWCINSFWAPACIEYKGAFYLYYSANWSHNPDGDAETFRIGVARSDSPLGPFKNVFNKPLFDCGFPVIDADVFLDDDGKKYITCSRCCYKHKVGAYEESHIYGAELDDDMLSLRSDLVLLLKPEQDWENWSIGTGRRWNEGSFLFKHNRVYYLMFSANHYADKEYAIGYATSAAPLGPYRKYKNNPILMHDYPRFSGPGHNCMVRSIDEREWLIVYHAHTDPMKGGEDRQVYINRITISMEGNLTIVR